MSFRDRPEYKQWREDVFRLFGHQCIRCGHDRNIHAHHVRPVNVFPELAFEPRNGVPLCGNCHSDVSSDELAHVEEFDRLQQTMLDGTAPPKLEPVQLSEELRTRAEQDPTNIKAVEEWFFAERDSQMVIDFYNLHRSQFRKTTSIYVSLARHLAQTNRYEDSVRVADAAAALAKHDAVPDQWIVLIAFIKATSLCELKRVQEAITSALDVIARFPQNGDSQELGRLHQLISKMYWRTSEQREVPIEMLEHAVESARLCSRDIEAQSWASFVTRAGKDFASSFKYANAVLSLAVTRDEKVRGHLELAEVYSRSAIYSEAIKELRQALGLDDNNLEAISCLAHCLYMDDRAKDALSMARRCLLIAPNDEVCLDIVARIENQ